MRDDLKAFLNLGLDLGDDRQAYAFGSYAQRVVEGGFFFRNPDTRPGVFSNDDGVTRLVADLDGVGVGGSCPVVPVEPPTNQPLLDQVIADPNCFVFNELFPGGFTPRFGGDVNDIGGVIGTRGALAFGVDYDISFGLGRSEVEYFIFNTVNATLGPQTPTSFKPGTYVQLEKNLNIDLSYPLALGFLASDLNIAAGFEWREEQFEARVGDPASFEVGPLVDQGFSVGSNGFPGFGPQVAGKFDRTNVALYLDLEANVTESILIGAAGRWEHFSDFGSTWNGKVSARWDPFDFLGLRATVSTGFRAPTPGQSNINNVSTVFEMGELVNRGTIPPTNPVAQFKGGKQLEPEESVSYSAGVVGRVGDLTLTADYFHIDVDDRVTQSQSFTLTPAEQAQLIALGVTGAQSLSTFRFFVNDFNAQTQGVDVVATYPLELFGGETDLSLVFNWTETQVEKFDPALLDATRIKQIEEGLPELRGAFTLRHTQGPITGLTRVNYFGDYFEAHLDDGTLPIFPGDEWTVDVELTYTFRENYHFTVGADNVFDNVPDRNPWADVVGSRYPETSAMGFNGGFYYFRVRVEY